MAQTGHKFTISTINFPAKMKEDIGDGRQEQEVNKTESN